VHRIQEAQTTIYHTLWELTLDELDSKWRHPERESDRRSLVE
jgi:hypothetical protein